MITVTITNRLEVGPVDRLPNAVKEKIWARLTFPNLAYQEAEKRGFSTWNIPELIQSHQVVGDTLIIPRGFIRQVIGILKNAGVQYQVDDRRRALPSVYFTFKGELWDFQVEAVEAMASRDFGTMAAPTGRG